MDFCISYYLYKCCNRKYKSSILRMKIEDFLFGFVFISH